MAYLPAVSGYSLLMAIVMTLLLVSIATAYLILMGFNLVLNGKAAN